MTAVAMPTKQMLPIFTKQFLHRYLESRIRPVTLYRVTHGYIGFVMSPRVQNSTGGHIVAFIVEEGGRGHLELQKNLDYPSYLSFTCLVFNFSHIIHPSALMEEPKKKKKIQ